ncbi:MAG: alkaline phosphatase family protein [Tenericutes bacterium]|nr:alkaline phosphatase family protein [Mycoplasmatota bacterium]
MIVYPDYTNSILNVSATILKHYKAPTIYPAIPELEKELKKNFKHVVLVLLDGMGMNILDRHLDYKDFLSSHVVKSITSIFPPTTVAATNTVLSGLPPLSSGYLGWVQYFKKEKTNLTVFTNADFYDHNRTFDTILRDKYLKYPTIYDQIKAYSPRVKTFELFPNFRANGFKTFKEQTNKVLEIIEAKGKTFTYVYWTQPDLVQHDYGIDSLETKNILKQLNEEAEYLANQINDQTILIFIADHGLVDVKSFNLSENYELTKLLKRQPSIESRATNFFVKPFRKKKFKFLFDEDYGAFFKLYTKSELMKSNLLGYGPKHAMLDSFLGDYIAIATDEYIFNFMKGTPFKAHHAGLTKGEMEVPLIIYHKEIDA